MNRSSLRWLLLVVVLVAAVVTGHAGPISTGEETVPRPDRHASLDGASPASVARLPDLPARLQQQGIAIEQPSGVYVLGSRTTVRGRVSPTVDSVALYVRSNDSWQLLDIDGDGERTSTDAVPVAADGTWTAPDVALSAASTVVTGAGSYSIGVVPTADVVDANGTLPATLSTLAFAGGRTDRNDLFVRQPDTSEPLVFRDVNDQIAVEDGVVDVIGLATGTQAVLVLVVDARGQLASEIVDADDGRFETEFDLDRPDGSPLNEGFAVGIVLSPGRDGMVGDGELGDERAPELADLRSFLRARIDAARERGAPLSQSQVLEIVEAETVADTASDDLRTVDTFVVTDATTTVDAVYPANATNAPNATNRTAVAPIETGETAVVEGRTNRRPNDTTLFVDIVRRADGRTVAGNTTTSWGPDGRWRVTIPTDGLPPGDYFVRVDDGDDRDVVRLRIVAPTPPTATSGNGTTTPAPTNDTATPTNGTGTPGPSNGTATPGPGNGTATPTAPRIGSLEPQSRSLGDRSGVPALSR